MYCKYCGKEIKNNSNYCEHCGKKQDSKEKSSSNFVPFGLYVIWVCFNLYLLTGFKYHYASKFFYPFTTRTNVAPGYASSTFNQKYYDGSEFIVYVIVIPVIIYLIYRYINKSNS